MKKFLKLGKRMLALFIVVLLNINSYAAVGANDGSAFVTKAEFDALINTFNEQMDSYQSGLNAKIDGAIANYLAGLSSYSATNIDSYLENMRVQDRTFYNNSTVTMLTTGTTSKVGLATNFVLSAYRAGGRSGFVRGNSNGTGTYELVYDYSVDRFTDRKIFINKETINGVDGYYPNITDVTTCVVRPNHLISGTYTNVSGNNFTTDVALPSTTNWNISSTVRIPGNNTCAGGSVMGQSRTFEVNHSLSYVNGEGTPSYLKYIPACQFNNTTNMDHQGIIYLNRYDLDSDTQTTVNDVKGSSGGCKAYDYISQTSKGERGTDTFTYKFYEPKKIIKTPFNYINYTASVQYNDIVEKKDGIPIVTIDQPCTLEIPLNFVNSTGRCTVAIRKTRFGISEPSTTQATADIYWNDNVPSGDLDKIVIEQTDSTKTTYWLKVLPNNANATSQVSLYGKVRLIVQ